MLLKNLIYILQSENYDYRRFFKFAYKNLKWWDLEKRKKIDWTAKAKLLWLVSSFLFVLFCAISFYFLSYFAVIILVFSIVLLPIIIGLANLIVKPVDLYLKIKITKKAKLIIEKSDIQVIGITGSYGKTSTKEILYSLLSQKYKVIKTSENINTDIGIANFIIKSFEEIGRNDFFIVEMGAYKVGDIKNICKIVSPKYSILTGINESHLERFGSIENTIKTKFELPENTSSISYLNIDDENINNNYKKYKIKKYYKISVKDVGDVKTKPDFSGIAFTYKGTDLETVLLAKHSINNALPCLELASGLGLDKNDIINGMRKVRHIKHRMEPIFNKNTNITVIDDSYNGNLNGIISGLEVLQDAKGRKVVLTPGLVEQGKKTKEVHNKIGELYSSKADLVLLIKNQSTPFILEGIKKSKKPVEHIVYETAERAHNDLSKILRSGDTIIFQNDLSDNYY